MRLIDADKLEEKIDDISRGYTSVYGVEEDDIYNAETVEAIPVSWIESEIKKLRTMDFDLATMTAGQIEAMLKKWREEQKHETD